MGVFRRPGLPRIGYSAAASRRRYPHSGRAICRGKGAPWRLHDSEGRRFGRRPVLGEKAGASHHPAGRSAALSGREVTAGHRVLAATIERVFREEYGRAVSVLIRAFGSIELAQDAVQDAFCAALRKWPASGVPPSPAGWIVMTARHRAIDRLRRLGPREQLRSHPEIAELAERLATEDAAPGPPEDCEEEPMGDDRLQLIFTCCHPALAMPAQVALTLRLLGGLTTT